MNEQEALVIFDETKAVVSGHFLLTSGLHADRYVSKERVYAYTTKLSKLCRAIAEYFQADDIEAVVSPVIGGVALSQWIANHLTSLQRGAGQKEEVLAIFADKQHDIGKFNITRGYDEFVEGKRVLVADDIRTTGGSIERVIEVVKLYGGRVVGTSVLWDRGDKKPDLPKFFSLINVKFPTWVPAECPSCKQAVPINRNLGKGKELVGGAL